MRGYQRRAVLGGLLLLGLLLAACAPAAPSGTVGGATDASPGMSGTRTHEGGQVTLKATWEGPSAGPVFTVTLDTHAVDLDGYDLGRLAVLRADGGREVRPSGWDAPTGGHHREGRLVFPAIVDGVPVITPAARAVELIIRDVAGVPERSLRWER